MSNQASSAATPAEVRAAIDRLTSRTNDSLLGRSPHSDDLRTLLVLLSDTEAERDQLERDKAYYMEHSTRWHETTSARFNTVTEERDHWLAELDAREEWFVRMRLRLDAAEAALEVERERSKQLADAIRTYRQLGAGMRSSAADEDAGTVTEVHTLDALESLLEALAAATEYTNQ